jgi:hypothetical protein
MINLKCDTGIDRLTDAGVVYMSESCVEKRQVTPPQPRNSFCY